MEQVAPIIALGLMLSALLGWAISHVGHPTAVTEMPRYPAHAIALVYYDKPEGRVWIEVLVDVDSLTAPELVRIGNLMYEWTQAMWRAKTNA